MSITPHQITEVNMAKTHNKKTHKTKLMAKKKKSELFELQKKVW